MHNTVNSTFRKSQSEKGFTLIEMAIVVLLIGIAIGALAPLYKIHLKKKAVENTQLAITAATNEIGNFRGLYGRYPCPASLTAVRGDADYGRENCDDPAIFATAAGNCTNGICVQESVRSFPHRLAYTKDLATGEYGPAVDEAPRVLVGFLPFRHLGLDESSAYDSNDNRIMYAITEPLAYSEIFTASGGGIEIIDESGQTVLGDAGNNGSAHFMVFSYGDSNDGAYTQAGTQRPCPADAALESENCDFARETAAIFQVSERNTSDNAVQSFDDIVNYFTQDDVPLWQLSEDNPGLGDIHHKATGNFGVNVDKDVEFNEETEIVGTLRAQDDPGTLGVVEGKIVSQRICDENGGNCFEPRIFAGQLDDPADPADDADRTGGLRCPDDDPDGTGTYMVGIRNGTPVCEDEVTINCPQGQYLRGVDANGQAICDGPPARRCEAQDVNLCEGEGTERLPGDTEDGTTVTITSGANASATYRCDDGDWVQISSTGNCTCEPDETTRTLTCSTYWNEPGGTYTQTTTTICPSGQTTTTSTYDEDCTCREFTITDVENCPNGLSGQYTRTRERTCNPRGIGPWDESQAETQCVCEESSTVKNRSCPAGQTGNIQQEWNVSCDSGQPVGEWGDVVSDSCADKVCRWKPNTDSELQQFKSGPKVNTTCECGSPVSSGCYKRAGNGWYRQYASCSCQ